MGTYRILISRTDAIGDVVLTLPLAGILKQYFPQAEIYFLGKTYTRDIIELSEDIDGFLNWSEISEKPEQEGIELIRQYNFDSIIHVFPDKAIARMAKKAGIANRIGTSHRIYNRFYCNRLINFSRKKSNLHEAQLNTKLLKGLGIEKDFSLDEIQQFYHLRVKQKLDDTFAALLDPEKKNIILHSKSKGSAREWGLDNFRGLISLLPPDKYRVFLSGTEEEGKLFRDKLLGPKHVMDISGKMSLSQFIAFINAADALVAASTGPLHIAAALGKVALGIYPPIKPMHPGRWKPLGPKASYIVQKTECSDCRKGGACHCMLELSPTIVKKKLTDLMS